MDAFDGLNEFTINGKTFVRLEDTRLPGFQYVDSSGRVVTVWQQIDARGLVTQEFDYNSYDADPRDDAANLFMEKDFTDYRACAVAGLRAVGL